MRGLVLVSASILTVLFFASGYAISFLVTVLAMALDLPGPYADHPVAWLWFGLSIAVLFGISWLFCRWLVRRAERRFADTEAFR